MGFDAFLKISFNAEEEMAEVVKAITAFVVPVKYSEVAGINLCSLRGYEIWEHYLQPAQVEEQFNIEVSAILENYPEEPMKDCFETEEEHINFHKEFKEFLEWLVAQEGTIWFHYAICY